MQRYETLILAAPEITADESSELEKKLDALVKDVKGGTISFERWGKYRLSYPIRNNDYGVYFLFRFEADSELNRQLSSNIKELFVVKYNDVVMRSMTSVIPKGRSLAYNRPESLEEVPTRDVDTFLRENKMEGLIKSGSPKKAAAPEQTAAPSEESSEETAEA